MQKISVLSDELISQIAAGEVVERPASAVKELVENSIDAGASRISIEIEEGGMKKIRVVDDGLGMSAADAELAFTRHATSKISSIEDLFSIRSMGFRGEALASIASIARVVMKTRTEDSRTGTLIEINGGKRLRLEDFAGVAGTDISVFGLFEHTPVRKKYMKLERTEYGHIFELLCSISLGHPEIAFKFRKDEEEVFDLPGGQSLRERIRLLFGVCEGLLSVNFHQSNLILSGFVGKPELSRSSKKYQFLFVNGRAIEDRSVSHAVREAFHSLLMHEKYPWFLLNIEIDPAMIDVNVHPRKSELKFLNQQEVYRAVMGSVHHALQAEMMSPTQNSTRNQSLDFMEREGMSQNGEFRFEEGRTSQHRHDSQHRPEQERPQQRLVEIAKLSLRPIAQIANSYIVAEGEEGLVLIDQHAAHERVRYEKLMENLANEKKEKQSLLVPLELNLGLDNFGILQENLQHFLEIGFEIEEFGGKTFLLRAVPLGVARKEPEKLILEILADLGKDHVKDVREKILTYAACRGAIKFGDPLRMSEIEALLGEMEKTKNARYCPHGRPAIITFTFDSLETMFKRRNF